MYVKEIRGSFTIDINVQKLLKFLKMWQIRRWSEVHCIQTCCECCCMLFLIVVLFSVFRLRHLLCIKALFGLRLPVLLKYWSLYSLKRQCAFTQFSRTFMVMGCYYHLDVSDYTILLGCSHKKPKWLSWKTGNGEADKSARILKKERESSGLCINKRPC
jgi:hypothetical protein